MLLRRELGGLEVTKLAQSTVRIAIASAALAAVSFGVWDAIDSAVGRSLGGQIASLTCGLGAGGLIYVAVARLLRVPELDQIMRLLRRRG